MPPNTIGDCINDLWFVFDAPLLFEGLKRLALNVCMAIRQHQHGRRAHTGSNQPEILGGMEQARIPTLPARQQAFDLFAQSASFVVRLGRHFNNDLESRSSQQGPRKPVLARRPSRCKLVNHAIVDLTDPRTGPSHQPSIKPTLTTLAVAPGLRE
jgi:hypothetical protein